MAVEKIKRLRLSLDQKMDAEKLEGFIDERLSRTYRIGRSVRITAKELAENEMPLPDREVNNYLLTVYRQAGWRVVSDDEFDWRTYFIQFE